MKHVLFILIAITTLLSSCDRCNKKHRSNQSAVAAQKTEVVEENPPTAHAYVDFAARHNHPDQYWPVNPASIATFKQRVLRLLASHRQVSKKTTMIANLARGIGFVAYDSTATTGQLRQASGGAVAVVVMDKDQYLHSKIFKGRALLAYARGTGTIVTPSITYSDEFLAGTIIHELGHLLAELEALAGRRPALGSIGSNEQIREEVEMHELQAEVMNVASDGMFFQLLDAVIKRSGAIGEKGKYSWLHKAVDQADIAAYERMFGLEQAGECLAKTAIAQFKLMLELRYVDQGYNGIHLTAQKVSRYRRLTGR